MHKLYEYVCDELKDLERKAEKGKLSLSDIQYADTLAHMKKNLLKADEMTGEGEYSGAYPYADGMGGDMRSYRIDGGSYGSYAGRRNARRDSMGRYSNEGYSMANDDMIADLREMMETAPEGAKSKIRNLISDLERM